MLKLTSSLLIFALFLTACKEFIEPSLEKSEVRLLAPSNGVETSKYNQTFWWEPVPDALAYRLQIVQPSFDSIAQLVVDTVVQTDKFIYTLEPGKYEWRIRAENGSSESPYYKSRFTIHPSSIKNQSVQLSAPANGALTNKEALVFQWMPLYNAGKYRLQVDDNNFADETNMVVDELLTTTSFNQRLVTEAAYKWRVRAENDTAQSQWSAPRTFTYDKTPPEKVTLLAPANRQTVVNPARLSWSAAAGAAQYELVVYKTDSTSVFSPAFPQVLNITNYSFSGGTGGERLVWRVRAIDAAGNRGEFSSYFSYSIQ